MIASALLEQLENIVQLAYERGTSRDELVQYVRDACDEVDQLRQEVAREKGGEG
jgi:hypothetical protein